jgi:hypothetical protein
MNAFVAAPEGEDTRADFQRVRISELIEGRESAQPIQFSDQLDEMRDRMVMLVWDLEKPDAIDDPHPLANVSCPRCSPSGYNSSWFLDCRKIGEHLQHGRMIELTTLEVAAEGASKPTLDRALGYAPHGDAPKNIEEFRKRYRGAIVDTDE